MKNFEHYKDVFMRCKGRNLECVASKEILKRKCANNCAICVEFIKKWLYEEYKEPIKLTQSEYDLLINCKETTDYNENDIIKNYWIIKGMKQKGYFKNIELSMNFKEVLENCEVVENVG